MVSPLLGGHRGVNPRIGAGQFAGVSPPGGSTEFEAVPSRSGARLSRSGRPLGRSAGVKGRAVPAPCRVWDKAQRLAPCVSFFCVPGSYRLRVWPPRRRGSGGRGENLPGGGRGKAPLVWVWAPHGGVGHDPGKGRTVGGRLFFEEKKNSVPLSAQRNFFKNFFSMASPVQSKK